MDLKIVVHKEVLAQQITAWAEKLAALKYDPDKDDNHTHQSPYETDPIIKERTQE